MTRALTTKQFNFVQAVTQGLNGIDAAREAKYKGNNDTLKAVACENLTKPYIVQAINEAKADLEWKDEKSRINIDKRFDERYQACVDKKDNTNAIRCVENMAKNRGYYELDNKQKAEQRQLSEKEKAEAQRIAAIRLTQAG